MLPVRQGLDTPLSCPPGLYSAIRDPFGIVIELLEFTE